MLGNVSVTILPDGKGKYWEKTFETFKVQTFIPATKQPEDIINFGFAAPYLCVFPETPLSMGEAIHFADSTRLTMYASLFAGSVNFFTPIDGDWDKADLSFYQALVAESRISQYYKDGYAIMWDRFNKCWGDNYIRGCIPKICVIGAGKSADYIARTLLKHVDGLGIFGPGDITPACCILERVSALPESIAEDIPVFSVANTDEINERLSKSLQYFMKHTRYDEMYYFQFLYPFRRMVRQLEIVPQPEKLDLLLQCSSVTVKTAKDNRGDDRKTSCHKIGYLTYINKEVKATGKKVPLLLSFHGGGDSAYYMATISGWYKVAAANGFLLVCIENHLNSTATEMMELISHLKNEFNIDSERIYATGFSMGGCKSWDMMQEYPKVFAAVAPMDATFEVGCNSYGEPVPDYNKNITLPVFYAGGELTPLPELPFQAQKCIDRVGYVFAANKVKAPYNVLLTDKDSWTNPIWGIDGDAAIKLYDEDRDGILTLQLFESENACCYSVFASISNQGHEVRKHTCENAWKFMSSFRRLADGSIAGGKFEDIKALYQ